MDVSRIEAISPKQIDWRKLTAKEIIKYDNQGVEVPDEYLQWAKEFNESLTAGDSDDTTYEMSASASANITPQTQNEVSSDEEASEPEKQSAADVRDDMLQSGTSYIKVAKTFRKESDTKANEAQEAESVVSGVGNQSDTETENLETALTSLMAEADGINSQINSLKNKSSNENMFSNNVMKIKQLQRQLRQLGMNGQSMAAQTGADLNDYTSIIASQADIGEDAIDYGGVTVEMGEELKRLIFFAGLGRKVVKSGENAINNGEQLGQTSNEVLQRNSENIRNIENRKNEISSKTGVAEIVLTNNDKDSGQSGNEDKAENEAADNVSKNTNKAQEALASGNLDEILKYKLRKGEDITTSNA